MVNVVIKVLHLASTAVVFLINSLHLASASCIPAPNNVKKWYIRVNVTLTSKYHICLWRVFKFSKVLMDFVFKIDPGLFGRLLHRLGLTDTILHQLFDFRKVEELSLGPQDNHWYFKESSSMVTYR